MKNDVCYYRLHRLYKLYSLYSSTSSTGFIALQDGTWGLYSSTDSAGVYTGPWVL